MKTIVASRFSMYSRIKENGVVEVRVTNLRTQETHQLTWNIYSNEVIEVNEPSVINTEINKEEEQDDKDSIGE